MMLMGKKQKQDNFYAFVTLSAFIPDIIEFIAIYQDNKIVKTGDA